jgi:hypothetical protein
VRVLLFGRLGDVAGWRERVFEPAPASLSALRALIAGEDPALGEALLSKGAPCSRGSAPAGRKPARWSASPA